MKDMVKELDESRVRTDNATAAARDAEKKMKNMESDVHRLQRVTSTGLGFF